MAGRYESLTERLRGREEAVIDLTFAEIDRLIGGLPASARRHPAWWANSRRSQPQARYWLDAGRRASPDFNGGRVRFTLGAETPADPRPRRSTAGRGGASAARATGEVVQAAIRFEWLDAGAVTPDASGRALLPTVPAVPGVYRFTFRAPDGTPLSIYVGQSDDLARRMNHYRNPGPTQRTNVRLAARVQAVLGSGGAVDLSIATDATIDGHPLDLTQGPARLLAENAALVLAGRLGVALENL